MHSAMQDHDAIQCKLKMAVSMCMAQGTGPKYTVLGATGAHHKVEKVDGDVHAIDEA